jgi:hypothetical protein
MSTHIHRLIVTPIFVAAVSSAMQAQHSLMPPGTTHQEHLAQIQKDVDMKKRGVVAMGFDQDQATHHFRLYETGGAIEVVANDPADDTILGQVRTHLKEIASEFARGDFAKPFATHGEMPPGVRTMKERATALAFRYEETPTGGRVRIITSDATAKDAVHEFLTYQIREHRTGDSLVPKE